MSFCFFVPRALIVGSLLFLAAGIGQSEEPAPQPDVMPRQLEAVDPEDLAAAGPQHMRDILLAAVVFGQAVAQRCMVTPPLTRSIEIGTWLVKKYGKATALHPDMLTDLETTAQAYCDNNG